MEVANDIMSKMEALECDNASKKDEIQQLNKEINSLQRDEDESAARVADLESEAVVEMSAAEEARLEAAALTKVLEERESNIRFLEREVKILKQEKIESEMKVRDLERKNSVYEVKLTEERSKRVRAEEEMKENVGDREREIEVLKQRIEELKNVEEVEVRVVSEGNKGLVWLWPIMAAGSGAVAIVFYFCFRKQRR